MNNETKLTAQDLALYLGCEACFVTAYNYDRNAGKLIGVRDEPRGVHCSIIPTGKSQPELAWVYAHSMPDEFKPAMPFSEDAQLVFPVLRPLSDMTHDEEKEFVQLCAGSQIARFSRDQSGASNWRQWLIEFENGDVDHLVMNESGETWFRSYFEHTDIRKNFSNTINQHKQTVWLLRHHFDLFGWIESGLAIDKTKTK